MFTITTDQLNIIISNVNATIGDLMPLILLFLGVFIGLYIVEELLWTWRDREIKSFIEKEKNI